MRSAERPHAGKLWPIVKVAVALVRDNPKLLEDEAWFRATLEHNVEELKDRSKCANCGASMMEYVYEFDVLDAIMLIAMGKAVKARQREGMYFTDANRLKVQGMDVSYGMKSRTTQMSKLGLIAKLRGSSGRQERGMWVVTARGWAALRGEGVPRYVRLWRDRIEERAEDRVTIYEALRAHGSKVEQSLANGRTPRNDYRAEASKYDHSEWFAYGEVHEGKII